MYRLTTTKQFEKDYKLCNKRGYKLRLLNTLLRELETTGSVPVKHRPRKLIGNYKDCWECHIQSDWLLTWLVNNETDIIELIRTGTHSDLF
jgi:mRNA interferase YafQ